MSPSALDTNNGETRQETITELSAPLNEMSSIDPLITLLAMTYRTQTPSPAKQDRLLTLMHTISTTSPVGAQPKKIYSHEEQRNSFIRFLSPVLNGMAGLQDFGAAVQEEAVQDPEGFRTFWQLEERNLLSDMVEGGQMGGASPGADVVFLEEFVGRPEGKVALGSEGTLFRVGPTAELGQTVKLVKESDGAGGVSFHAEE